MLTKNLLVPLTALAVGVLAQHPQIKAIDGNGNYLPSYSPARAPAIPLAVRSPYLSTWSTTAGNSSLNSADVRFWTGDELGWEGMVMVDGVAYEFLGAGSHRLPSAPRLLRSAVPESVSYDSQYSNFTFAAGDAVGITASFFSPVTPRDVCRSSIPLSYFTVSAAARDGRPHDIRFYSDINGAWAAKDGGRALAWTLRQGGQIVGNSAGNGTAPPDPDAVYSWIVGQKDGGVLFGEDDDFADWGNISYSTAATTGQSLAFQSGFATDLRWSFVLNQTLANIVDQNGRGWKSKEPVFAFSHDAGIVVEASVRYTIGSVQTPAIKYLTGGGIQKLRPWWEQCYGDMFALIQFHWNDFDAVRVLGDQFEFELKADISGYYRNSSAPVYSNGTSKPQPLYANQTQQRIAPRDGSGGNYIYDPDSAYGYLDPRNFTGIAPPDVSEAQAYYSILALSARQVMHAYVYAVPPPGTMASGEPLMFQKEISSDGNLNTVDVLYPAMPFFLWANPEMLRWTLESLFTHQEAGFYPNGYSMHDMGSKFPNATGHVEGDDEYMPVEESGNMILMSYAYYKFTGASAAATGWLSRHYAQLRQWAEYLVEFSLIPAAQLSTDDFAGTLANQTNLALKGIIGLQAMSAIARATGNAADADRFGRLATGYYARWEQLAIDPSGEHALLAYQWRSSWGLLYNAYADKLLGLGLVGEHVYDMQSRWYARVSQEFGVPLDSRHHYTKSDWTVWAAATCGAETRALLISSLGRWLNSTTTDAPFTDLYETIGTGYFPTTPNLIKFKARPTVGGHFALLALMRASNGGGTKG